MKIILTVTVFFVLLNNIVHGYMYQLGKNEHPEFPGKCYYDFAPDSTVIEVNESIVRSNVCEKIHCNGDLTMTGIGCGAVGGKGPSCKIVQDESKPLKPFPACCPKIVCS